jgi:hypothetical protein
MACMAHTQEAAVPAAPRDVPICGEWSKAVAGNRLEKLREIRQGAQQIDEGAEQISLPEAIVVPFVSRLPICANASVRI